MIGGGVVQSHFVNVFILFESLEPDITACVVCGGCMQETLVCTLMRLYDVTSAHLSQDFLIWLDIVPKSNNNKKSMHITGKMLKLGARQWG